MNQAETERGDEEAARQFVDVAREYVRYIEGVAVGESPLVNLRELHGLLGRLQSAIAALPPVKPAGAADLQRPRANARCKLFDNVIETDRAAIMTKLEDDLGDMYRDLKDVPDRIGSAPLDHLIWEWRFAYYTHWGRHLVHAQGAVFSYLAAAGNFYG